ncbi:MAG: DUF6318 family protein [Brachybacterium tyrofermentans]
MSRRLLAIAAAAALTFTFAACDVGGDGPVTEPPQQVGTSDGGGAAPSDGGGAGPSDGDDAQTVAAADIPAPDPAEYAGMDEHTADGAEQAFRYYIAVSMWAHQTGDTELLDSLQTDDCGGCNYLNEDIDKLNEIDSYWGTFELNNEKSETHNSDGHDYEVSYFFTTSTHSRPEGDPPVRTTVDYLEYIAIGGMDWGDNGWTTSGMSIDWGLDVRD